MNIAAIEEQPDLGHQDATKTFQAGNASLPAETAYKLNTSRRGRFIPTWNVSAFTPVFTEGES